MKYVFFGTPRFAEIVLKELIDAGIPPIAIVCNPDRPVGRKHIITPPPTKMLAISASPDIDIIQPEKIDEIFINRLRALEPDFFVVAAYAKILPRAVLDIPRLGSLGVHPSLLPKYRGASPIQSAILAGEQVTGTTIYLIDEKMDHGPILSKQKLDIAEDGYTALEERLAKFGAELVVDIMPKFLTGEIISKPQDELSATFTKKFTAQDAFVTSEDLAAAECDDIQKANTIVRKMKALNPEPGVWTTANDGKRMKLLAGELRGGRLIIREAQKDGERPHRNE